MHTEEFLDNTDNKDAKTYNHIFISSMVAGTTALIMGGVNTELLPFAVVGTGASFISGFKAFKGIQRLKHEEEQKVKIKRYPEPVYEDYLK